MTPDQNSTNQRNANKGTKGTNRQYDKAQGNRGKLIQRLKESSKVGRREDGKR